MAASHTCKDNSGPFGNIEIASQIVQIIGSNHELSQFFGLFIHIKAIRR
jgi:hypothetical protein